MEHNKFKYSSVYIEELIPEKILDIPNLFNIWNKYLPYIIKNIWFENNDEIQSSLDLYCIECNIKKMVISVEINNTIKTYLYIKNE